MSSNFDIFLKKIDENGKRIVVLFSAKWCNSCKKISEKREKILSKCIEKSFTFFEINLNNRKKLELMKEKFNLLKIPTIIVIEEEKDIRKYEGSTEIENFVNFSSRESKKVK